MAVNAEVGAVEGKATIVGGLDVDFDGGMPDLTPFGEVSFEVDAYVRYGYLDGKASVRVDPKEITLSIEGSMVLGAGVKVPGGKARAGARYEVNGELKIPISALDPRLLVRLQAGDVTAMSELYSRLDADASGHLNLYEGVEVAGGIDAEVVRAEGGVTTMEKVGSIGFGD